MTSIKHPFFNRNQDQLFNNPLIINNNQYYYDGYIGLFTANTSLSGNNITSGNIGCEYFMGSFILPNSQNQTPTIENNATYVYRYDMLDARNTNWINTQPPGLMLVNWADWTSRRNDPNFSYYTLTGTNNVSSGMLNPNLGSFGIPNNRTNIPTNWTQYVGTIDIPSNSIAPDRFIFGNFDQNFNSSKLINNPNATSNNPISYIAIDNLSLELDCHLPIFTTNWINCNTIEIKILNLNGPYDDNENMFQYTVRLNGIFIGTINGSNKTISFSIPNPTSINTISVSNASFSGLSSQVYTATQSIIGKNSAALGYFSTSSTIRNCKNPTPIQISANLTSPNPAVTYTWTSQPASIPTLPNSPSINVLPNAKTVYTVTATDPNTGCSDTKSITIDYECCEQTTNYVLDQSFIDALPPNSRTVYTGKSFFVPYEKAPIINEGRTIEFINCDIYMGDFSRISIDRGAKVNSINTTYQLCGINKWYGIEVWGDAYHAGRTQQDNQGVLYMEGGSITMADVGILAAKRSSISIDPSNGEREFATDGTFNGGSLDINNVTFEFNTCHIAMLPYIGSGSANTPENSNNRIYNCTFNGILSFPVGAFETNNWGIVPRPNTYQHHMVYLEKQSNAKVLSNTFNNTNGLNSNGVTLRLCKNVDIKNQNHFIGNFTRAINSYQCPYLNIDNNEFSLFEGSIGVGDIRSEYLKIRGNIFQSNGRNSAAIEALDFSKSNISLNRIFGSDLFDYGIKVLGVSDYSPENMLDINSNHIRNCTTGLYLAYSEFSSLPIQISENNTDDCEYGFNINSDIGTESFNNVSLTCNEFGERISKIAMELNLDIPDQGTLDASAANKFYNPDVRINYYGAFPSQYWSDAANSFEDPRIGNGSTGNLTVNMASSSQPCSLVPRKIKPTNPGTSKSVAPYFSQNTLYLPTETNTQSFSIVDMTGRTVLSNASALESQYPIDLTSGIYLIKIKSKDGKETVLKAMVR